MLSKFDEYMCHQTPASFTEMSTTDRNWSDHIYAGFFDAATKTHVGFRFGKFPNRNVMDAAGGVALGGKQITVRASRALWPDVDTERVGPFEYQILEPLKKVRIFMGENDYGVSMDIELSNYGQGMIEPGGHNVKNGVTFSKESRFYQATYVSGKVKLKGKTYDIKKDTSFGFRDHTWGVRGYTGVPPEGNPFWRRSQASPEPGLMPVPTPDGLVGALIILYNKDYSLFYTHVEGPDGRSMKNSMLAGGRGYIVYPLGDPRPPIPLVDANFDWEFFPGTQIAKSFKGEIVREGGKRMQISCKYRESTFSLSACGYHGFRGWWIGKWMGPFAIDGEELDLTDLKTLNEAGSMTDQALEFNVDGEAAYGCIQTSAGGNLPKYGFKDFQVP